MAELTFKSPGVSVREIDLSGPTQQTPTGIPAGVIGTSNRGPAFVPITVGTVQDFYAKFGPTDGEKFGPIAVTEWLRNAGSSTYVRVLGVGKGLKRETSGDNAGRVLNAGFIAGSQQPNNDGNLADNPYANTGAEGRMYLFGCFMSQSVNSTVFSDAGIQAPDPSAASVVITVAGAVGTGETLTITDTAGSSVAYTAAAAEDLTADPPEFDDSTGGANAIATSLKACIESANGHPTTLTVSAASGGVITVTQVIPGVAGNTSCNAGSVTNTTAVGGTDSTSNYFDGGAENKRAARPILRGVLMAASGVVLRLSGTSTAANTPSNTSRSDASIGAMTGSVNLGSAGTLGNFVLLLNGHMGEDPTYPRIITASLDPTANNYFSKIFNKDPTKIQESGYMLYSYYDIYPEFADVTGSGVISGPDGPPERFAPDGGKLEDIAFMVTSSLARNVGNASIPNFENFQDRFRISMSPSVISQVFGSDSMDLFRVSAIDDGQTVHPDYPSVKLANNRFKVSVANIAKSNSEVDKFGTFDLIIRDFYDNDDDPVILEEFRGLNLNPKSDNYVARRVGDQKVYFDFDLSEADQRIVVQGSYPNVSNYVRVELSDALSSGEVPDTGLPVGFRGPSHLVTSGSDIVTQIPAGGYWAFTGSFNNLTEMPVPYRYNLTVGSGSTKRANNSLHWGVQFEKRTKVFEPNASKVPNPTIESFTRYFPNFQTSWRNVTVGENAGIANSDGTVLDCDVFNKNKFTLENIQVKTGSDGKVDMKTVEDWTYVRAGGISADATNKTRALSVVTDFGIVSLRPLNKFSFFVQGGWNGVNVRDSDSANLTNKAIREEMTWSARGEENGPTVKAYKKALDVMGNTADVEIQLLAIPGIRHSTISDDAITTVEDRFDAVYIMDIQERDTTNTVVTASVQLPNVENTVNDFTARALNTSFAAAYFPDVLMPDPNLGNIVQVPPSVAVLGAFSLNDKVGHPWFAPAGFTRGSLAKVTEAAVRLNRDNLDQLYNADINPITAFPTSGPVVFGQKTLQVAQSALDRVNVRRLLIEIRRQVRKVADKLLFEPNREDTLNKFSALVNPLLKRIQDQQGIERFKVRIDTTTTTQVDVENNTIRGKIFLQPTRTAEFISLDFIVSNAGAEI